MASDSNNNVIVSRIQNRRGLKQDLPQPLRPGEIGFATDSRQVYIGSEPDDLQNAQYNGVSYFEATINSIDHTKSIANNQLIAFSVPFVKWTRGEFNGISNSKSWQAADARSILDPNIAQTYYMSADFPVFRANTIAVETHTVESHEVGSTLVYVNASGSDSTGNIRVGDIVSGDDITGSNVSVSQVIADTDNNRYAVTLTVGQNSLSDNSNLFFTPESVLNYNNYQPVTNTTYDGQRTRLLQGSFKSTDVTVHKNGRLLLAEQDAQLLGHPSAVADYTLDASDTSPAGNHVLTLRTRPSTTDELTLCYYSNANVIQAIQGIESTGKIAPGLSSVNSFYTEYSIPEYRAIPTENILVNTTTGIGFIALEQKHISVVAEGANLDTTRGLILGNILVSRPDQILSVNGLTADSSTVYQFTLDSSFASLTPVGDGGTYRFNRVLVTSADTNDYFHDKVFDVDAELGSGTYNISIGLPADYEATRPASANIAPVAVYPGNGFTSNTSATQTVINLLSDETDGVSINDYIRIVDASGDPASCELHGAVMKVIAKNNTSITVNIDSAADISGNTVPNFTSNIASVYFLNHGSSISNVSSVYQIRSESHGVTTNVSEIVGVDDASSFGLGTNEYSIFGIANNTMFVSGVTMPTNNNISTGLTGTFYPVLDNSYAGISVTPVLAIDVSNSTSVRNAITTVNKELVDLGTGSTVQIFPMMDFIPQADNSQNAVYFSQKPAYTSLSAGGIDFRLHEDSVRTLNTLGLTEGIYTRQDNTVRAKLETWMNDLVNNRDINLFTDVFLCGDAYSANTSLFKNYDLVIDSTNEQILFSDRNEASNFNYLVNILYGSNAYDRSLDSLNGIRGLVNIRNNIELETRESALIGEKTVSYDLMNAVNILTTDSHTTELLRITTGFYNTYVLEYSIAQIPSTQTNKYVRTGTMRISTQPDSGSIVFSDNFSSTWNGPSDPVVEPKFKAELDGTDIVLKMESQRSDPDDPGSNLITHNLGSNLKLKYITRRWSSIT